MQDTPKQFHEKRPRAARRTVCAFLVVTALALLVHAAIYFWPLPPYSDPRLRAALACLPTPPVVAKKLEHLATMPVTDILLFGNSRMLYVAARDVGISGQLVFNASIPGSTFRQNVRLLAEISSRGLAPKLALISLDNLGFGYWQGSYYWPLPPERWTVIGQDFVGLLRSPDATRQDVNTFLHGALRDEGRVLAALIGGAENLKKVEVLWRLWTGAPSPCLLMHEDGSAAYPEIEGVDPPPAMSRLVTPPYPLLELDFARLARIQAAGTRVVVYESPVHPAYEPVYENGLDEEGHAQRRRLLAACRSNGIECHPAPRFPASGVWYGPTHAPPRLLGAWLAERAAAPPPSGLVIGR